MSKWGKRFSIYSNIVLFSCNYTLSISNCCHKVSNIPSCAFVTSFSSETKIKPLSRLSPCHSSWSSDLVKRLHLRNKSCSIQKESYRLLVKLFRKFTKNFSSKLNFRSFLVRTLFLWIRVHFRPAFPITLPTVSLLVDGRIPAFTITLFTQKFSISSCKSLVYHKIFFFCWADSFGGLP